MLAFLSNDTAHHTVSPGGVVTLVGNSFLATNISVVSVCAPVQAASAFIYGNLLAQPLDVDLGAQSGAPLPPTNTGQALSVPVYVNAGGANLLSFQITLVINSTLLAATACTAGSGWSQYLFSCTLNSPPSNALLVGSAASTSATGYVQVAVITLQVVSATPTLSEHRRPGDSAHHDC
jgi:hypothetical protein